MFHFVLGSYHFRSMLVSCLAIDLTGSDIGLKFHDVIIGLYPLHVSHLQMGSSKICSKWRSVMWNEKNSHNRR